MGRNSKDNSLIRYEQLLMVTVRYNDYIHHPRPRLILASKTARELPEAIKYVKEVKVALSKIEQDYREIIINEFFNKNKRDSCWWTPKYSKTTYYRIRNIAIQRFLEVFEQ